MNALRLSLARDFSELARVRPEVQRFLDRHGSSDRTGSVLHLALEEIFTNIVKYGSGAGGLAEVDVVIRADLDDLLLTVEDDGERFDPTAQIDVDPSEAMKPGGRGLLLLRKMVDSMRYERVEQRNRLTLRIRGRSSP